MGSRVRCPADTAAPRSDAQAFGTAHKIVAGTDRDCLHTIDLFSNFGAADLPEVLITDTGAYSDLVFGIAQLLGVDYRPALADLPDQKGWRADSGADYGSLNTFARGKLDLDKVRRHWDEILRLIASIYTSQVSSYDVVRALQRDGHPTALAEAIATYGRICKTLHILSIIDSEPYRRGIKGMQPPRGTACARREGIPRPSARTVPAVP
jgi:TnpA family transposase